MGLQLIFVVETNKECKSDCVYIKNTISRFYDYNNGHIKLSYIYMNGKGNYKRMEPTIEKIKKQYNTSEHRKSVVIYCFDCDDYNNDSENRKFIDDAKSYCYSKGFEFVWFYNDIESVYLGKKISNHGKKKAAKSFQTKKQIMMVDKNNLSASNFSNNSSNILNILDKFLPPP